MTPESKPIEAIRDLFVQTAKAVVDAQKILDEKLLAAVTTATSVESTAPIYSIPRTSMTLSFGLKVFAGKKTLIPFFTSNDATHQHHGHLLKFSVIGTSERPRPPSTDQQIQIRGFQPAFLLPSKLQDDLSLEVAQALEDGDWDFSYPKDGEPPDCKDVKAEGGKIRKDINRKHPERGMVVFKFDTIAPSYLVIRVTDKSKRDGIFVLEQNKLPKVTIYSFEDDGIENIRYAALHQFVLTLRRWLMGGAQPVPISDPLTIVGEPSELGLVALKQFAENVFVGYSNGLKFLSEQRDDETVNNMLPSFYDFDEVEGQLTYSVYYDDQAQRLKFSFGPRMSPDGTKVSDEISVVESKAFLRAYRANDAPEVEVKLIAPEFALTDEARSIVLKALKVAAADIAAAFKDLEPETYLEFIKGQKYQEGVVILLSYEGKTPKPHFLVAWPGVFQNQARDFVFSCELKDGKIEGVKRIMGLGQEIELDPIGGAQGVEITGKQYEPFHNAFHAVRIWRSRVEMEDQN